MTILDKIVENTQNQVEERKRHVPSAELRDAAEALRITRPSFYKALQQSAINIIAEVKKASPSKGLICTDFQPVHIAQEYDQGGAAAISVLTDESFFQGHLTFLDDIAAAVQKPLLRKDFIIDAYQVYEARLHQASAVLLLAGILDLMQLKELQELAHNLGLDALVEIHDFKELDKVLQAEAPIIGVNNRDLKSFQVDLQTSIRLAHEIPAEKLRISESGIYTHKDIATLQAAGYDAFLIGESLMRQSDRAAALRTLRGE